MCPEIWKLMKLIVGTLIWLILLAPYLIAGDSEKPVEPPAHVRIVATSNVAPTAPKRAYYIHRS